MDDLIEFYERGVKNLAKMGPELAIHVNRNKMEVQSLRTKRAIQLTRESNGTTPVAPIK